MEISVKCRCRVRRTIDTAKVGAWRLRCKTCGDVLYEPPASSASDAGLVEPPKTTDRFRRGEPTEKGESGRLPLLDTPVPPLLAPDDDGGDDTMFQNWLHASNELKVMLSSDGTDAPRCRRHPKRRIVAACTRCSELLCKRCLDRIDDEFVCAECVARVASQVTDPKAGALTTWFKKLFGK